MVIRNGLQRYKDFLNYTNTYVLFFYAVLLLAYFYTLGIEGLAVTLDEELAVFDEFTI